MHFNADQTYSGKKWSPLQTVKCAVIQMNPLTTFFFTVRLQRTFGTPLDCILLQACQSSPCSPSQRFQPFQSNNTAASSPCAAGSYGREGTGLFSARMTCPLHTSYRCANWKPERGVADCHETMRSSATNGAQFFLWQCKTIRKPVYLQTIRPFKGHCWP